MRRNVFAFLAIFATHSIAVPILDADYSTPLITPIKYNAGKYWLDWQQQVQAGLTGQLTSFEILAPDPGQATLYINLGSGWQDDNHEFSEYLDLSNGWNAIDVSSNTIRINSGDMFSIGIKGEGYTNYMPSFLVTTNNGYVQGHLWLTSSLYNLGQSDMLFKTYIEPDLDPSPQAIPEPSSIVLMGLALFRLGFRSRKRG